MRDKREMRAFLHSLGLVACLALAACNSDVAPYEEDCSEDRCESEGSKEAVLAALEGHGDAIANFMRANITDRGTLTGDYRDVLNGVGTQLGCDVSTQKTFVVLTNNNFDPRTIFTRCSDDAVDASRFFLNTPAITADNDVNPKLVHMSAWDADANTYRIYSTRPDESGEMTINVSPKFCLGCHGGPEELGYWQPLMNEMTNPWSGWNAEPGFASQLFDEFFDPAIGEGPVFQQMTAEDSLDSSSNFEPVIRAGIDRVTTARALRRLENADNATALDMLRPVFCDETVNFVSEIHRSGELRTHAIIDDALRALFVSIDSDRPWQWIQDTKIRLPLPDDGERTLVLIPVRGESTLQAELALVSRRVLTELQALRVRALDWSHPVRSELRCELYRAGRMRIEAGAADEAIAAMPADATNADLVPVFYDELMKIEINGTLIPLVPTAGKDVVALMDAKDANQLAELTSGDWSELSISLDDFGAVLDGYLVSATSDRAYVDDQRTDRACDVLDVFPITPIYPDLDCP